MANRNNNTKQFRKPLNLNIGLIVFAVILFYLIACIVMYMKTEHIVRYEVKEGSLATDRVYRGIILRDETVQNTQVAGYVNYYAREGERVAKNALVYIVDETGKLNDNLQALNQGENTLTNSELSEFRNEIITYMHHFDCVDFQTAYDCKYALKNSVLKLANLNMLSNLADYSQNTGVNAINYSYSPMTGIIGYADLLRSMQPDPEEQREAAGAIFHEAQRLEALSGKLLQLMGLGEHAPQLVPVQLDSVFAEARRAVAPALNGCILTMQSNGLTVQGDADLLCDLVINLVTNAAKASTPGSAIAVCAEQADGSIRLTVQDHGQGIPADKLARVVEPFYMVDKSRSRRQGGSGLGLALCSRIAQAHGGTLAMESELGKGTTVTVTLPAPNQTAAELAQEEPV